ncbi:TPA: hypothetical protein ACXJQO_000261 [Serratia marcescens]|jgi:hypothetical protein
MHTIKNPRLSGGENVLVHQVLQGGHEGLLTLNDYFKLGLFPEHGKRSRRGSPHFEKNLIKKSRTAAG